MIKIPCATYHNTVWQMTQEMIMQGNDNHDTGPFANLDEDGNRVVREDYTDYTNT